MQQIFDQKAWFQAYLDTPLSRPQNPRSPDEAMRTPGCCVKSKARENPHGLPLQTGIITSFDEDNNKVVIRGYGDAVSPMFVWTGTVPEYFATWDCD